MSILILLVIFLPLTGGILGYIGKEKSPAIATTTILLSFAVAILLLLKADMPGMDFSWAPGLTLSIKLDLVSKVLMALVCFISLLVHVFSTVYMQDDSGIHRFYAKLGFFTTSMLGLLIANDLILLFIFWELVGFASYLLVGFWYKKEEIPSSARLVFMVNRVADVVLLIGILWINATEGSIVISSFSGAWLVVPSVIIGLGAFGKSAQLPFSGWLTKAMVGPTPISALIHAATMVAAGVYLLYRIAPFLAPEALILIAILGTATAFYGGLSAMVQNDIKRVLAYSTISQLGYMVTGIGVGAFGASVFHLWTHAFFKAGLFLGAGSIIHYLHEVAKSSGEHFDAQDMRSMGGLRKQLPWTYRSFLLCALALSGVPFFSGFLSKEGIILASWSWAEHVGSWAYLIPDLLFISALFTAFYVTRMVVLVFFGESRLGKMIQAFAYKESWKLVLPLVILSVGSLWIFYELNPIGHHPNLLQVFGAPHFEIDSFVSGFTLFLSIALATGGISLGYLLFRPGSSFSKVYGSEVTKPHGFLSVLYEGFYLVAAYKWFGRMVLYTSKKMALIDKTIIDGFLHFVAIGAVVLAKVLDLVDKLLVDGLVNLSAWVSKAVGERVAGIHSREVQWQFFWALAACILILTWVLFL